ncbi:methyl-accepting chemotaxis protein [Ameyamaea chiangmaiensis NBRC 103196]|uniref:Globin-coupled sensor protein n=1 Tax=Ameyamaea chiangmaiensis TaxID=442969 RepID=A0A850PJI0_9PROT|nr:globin-coupled sensor protein [Ameyamaea chiangmaiensis]MBS4076421.1 globin-coupled sensor protein [Ameyamaea chiangmaiensis]NVN41441.1 globin-coupled sensor protein [Ameyamaea chiangmaiensis]GBQ61821.1 methyl-accepting chemotaxis protein [Ameyamaea chiangmaiensis NBRC 103196]
MLKKEPDTQSTAREPLGIADVERRLAFIQMGRAEREHLRALRPWLSEQVPAGLDRFYAQVRRTPEAAAFFETGHQMDHARSAQARHWKTMADAHFDQDYADKVRAIGEVHARIDLDLQWYVGGYTLVLDHLVRNLIETRVPRTTGLFARPTTTGPDLADSVCALVKAVLLDIELATSVYIEAAERNRRSLLEQQAREQTTVCDVISRALTELADKNLHYRIQEDLPPGYKTLRDDFNNSVAILHDALRTVSDNAAAIETAIGEIAFAAADLSNRTEQQAASLEETANSLAHITEGVQTTADHADEIRQAVARANGNVEKSEVVVGEAIAAMREIEKSSGQIGTIVAMIDEIAFQTNLLALNAGVEAARAGDAGRGFAIVAQEVRTLAHRSTDAARGIRELVHTSDAQVRSGVESVAETGKALNVIVEDVRHISASMSAITTAAREQSGRLRSLDLTVKAIDTNTQQNAAMVEESTAACQNLANEAKLVNRLIESFRLAPRPKWRTDDDTAFNPSCAGMDTHRA